jgi:hypothetical protein
MSFARGIRIRFCAFIGKVHCKRNTFCNLPRHGVIPHFLDSHSTGSGTCLTLCGCYDLKLAMGPWGAVVTIGTRGVVLREMPAQEVWCRALILDDERLMDEMSVDLSRRKSAFSATYSRLEAMLAALAGDHDNRLEFPYNRLEFPRKP